MESCAATRLYARVALRNAHALLARFVDRTTMSVLFETSLGELVIDLEVEKCPRTCENFLKLCKIKYYNLNAFFNGTFHPILDYNAAFISNMS